MDLEIRSSMIGSKEYAELMMRALHALLTGPGAACFLQQGVTGQVRLDAAAVVEAAAAITAGVINRTMEKVSHA